MFFCGADNILLPSKIWSEHSAFSSNLFHGHIFQKYNNQMSPPENKNVALEKFLELNHPQTSLLLSRRGPRCPDAKLSQHYISPKMTCCNFSNFCRKKFPGLTKKFLTFLYNFGGCNLQKSCGKTSRFIQ